MKREVEALTKLKALLEEECKRERDKNLQSYNHMRDMEAKQNVLSLFFPLKILNIFIYIGTYSRKRKTRKQSQRTKGRDKQAKSSAG